MDEELKAIVQRMIDAKESEENIAIVIQGWKPKKPNEVSTQGSKNTSPISTEPLPISQSNPFGNLNQTVPTINVATGKTGETKISAGTNKLSTGQQLKNSISNIGTSLKTTIPNLNIAATDIWEAAFGKELVRDLYKWEGRDFEKVRQDAYRTLEELNSQMLPTSDDIVDNIKNLSGSGLLVNAVDAIGSIVSTGVPAILTGGGSTIPTMIGQSIADYNTEKAKSKGISVDQLYKSGQGELKTPLLIGGLSGALELVGLKAVQKLATGAIKGAGAKKVALYALEVNKEGLTELIQGGLEEVNKAKALNKSDEEAATEFWNHVTSKKGLNEYLMGVVGSGGAAGLGHIVSNISNPETKKKVDENINEISELEKDIQNPEIPEDTKELLLKQVKSKISSISTEIDKADIKNEKLSDEDKVRSEKLSTQIIEVEQALSAPNLSPTTKTVLTEQKTALEEKLAEIKPVEPSKVISEVMTPVEEVKVTENVKTTPIEGVNQTVEVDDNERSKNYVPILGKRTKEQTEIQEKNNNDTVDEIYTSNEEIKNIGSKEQYIEYLKSVFPESNLKDILYHGSKSKFEEFDLSKLSTNSGDTGLFGEGIYFTPNKKISDSYGDFKYPSLLNVKSPFIRNKKNFDALYEKLKHLGIPKLFFDSQGLPMITQYENGKYSKEVSQAIKELGFDSANSWTEISVYNTESIHTLGSKKDVQGFKDFVEGKTPNKQQETKIEEPEISGIKKSLVPQKVVESVDFEKITDKEMQSLGKELYESGEIKPKEIVDEIAVNNQRRSLQPEEVTTLIHYKTVLDNEYRDLLKQKNQLTTKGEPTTAIDEAIFNKEKEISNFEVMSVITAQQQSLAFRLRQGLLDKDYNYATQVEKYKTENNGKIPEDVERKFKEYDSELKQLKEQVLAERQRVTELEEQQAIQNIVEDVNRGKDPKSPNRKKAEANLKKAKDEFSAFIKKSRGQANSFADVATFVKQASKLVKAYAELGIVSLEEVIAEMRKDYGNDFVDDNMDNIEATYQTVNADKAKPYIVKGKLTVPYSYIKNAVANGNTDINSLSEQVLAEIQDELPDATLRQVRDVITGYGKTVNRTKDELRTDINRAKRLGRLYSQLEDAENGIAKAKTTQTVEKLTKEEQQLKKQIKALEEQIPKTPEQIEAENNSRIEAKKHYYEKYIEEKEQRITEGNFAPKAKKLSPTPDAELLNLEMKANEVRAKYDMAHFENQQANRTKWQKIKDETIAWTLDLSRGLVAGFDLSVLGVQLIIHSTTTSPENARKIISGMFKALASESFEKKFLDKVRVHPLYEVMKASGLALQFPTTKISQRDAEIGTGRITRMWNTLMSPLKYVNQNLYEKAVRFNPSRASERAFTVPVDIARIQLFEGFAEQLAQDGITFEDSPEQYKLAAKVANVLTFRGNLGMVEPIAKEAAMLFFAPRKIAATMSMLNPAFYINTYRQNPAIAKSLMLKMARFLGQAVLFTMLFKAVQDDEEKGIDSNPDVFNPFSSDFMKLRIGNTRIDFFGGMSGYFIFMARAVTGNFKSTTRSKTEQLGDRVGIPSNRFGLAWDFSKNKFAPLPSLATRALEQQKGREIDWDEEAIKTVTPMWTQSISELYKEHPKELASFLLGMSLVGQSMNTYGTAEFLDRVKDKKLIDLVGRKNGAFQTRTKASLNFYDQNTGELRTANSDEFENFKEAYGEYIKEELQSNYSKLDKMTIPDFEKELKAIKEDAKKYAEYTIGKSINKINEISDENNKGKTVTYELTPDQIVERWNLVDKQLERLNKTVDRRTDNLARVEKISKSLARKKVQVIVEKDAEKIATREMLRKYFDITTKKSKLKIKE